MPLLSSTFCLHLSRQQPCLYEIPGDPKTNFADIAFLGILNVQKVTSLCIVYNEYIFGSLGSLVFSCSAGSRKGPGEAILVI